VCVCVLVAFLLIFLPFFLSLRGHRDQLASPFTSEEFITESDYCMCVCVCLLHRFLFSFFFLSLRGHRDQQASPFILFFRGIHNRG
jgi:hypothetical protein